MAEAFISLLLEQLASVVYQRRNEVVKLVLNADKHVKSLSSNLQAIQALLEDAEKKKQVMGASVRDWLEKLKDVLYEMDDVLDEWSIELLRQQEEKKQEMEGENALVTKKKVCFPMPSGCFCFGQVNKVIHPHNIAIARRIKELNEKLTLIADQRERFAFHQSTIGGRDGQLIQPQNTSSLVDISMIFGREEEKMNLLSKLLRESNQDGGRFLVIPIVGMGGMGKTTLAQLAYNDEYVTAHFDKKVWVCVSDPFDEIKIAKQIIEKLGVTQSSSNDLETLLLCIKTHVESRMFLLVLDDVWTEDQQKWENLKLSVIMQSCAEGSKILVTTRKHSVARMMRATNSMIHLDQLSKRDCVALFNRIAFLDREKDVAEGFGAIGEDILEKCKGLPLAVKTFGVLVWYKKTKKEWQDVLNSKIWELEEVQKQVFGPLLLSYYDLAPAVKRCLMYCAIFPKDYNFRRDNLIDLWMSQDCLQSNRTKERRKYQNYFEILAMGSFFQDFEKDGMENIIGGKMHDIVHDFVQFLTKKECIIIELVEGANLRMKLLGDEVRHMTLTSVPEGPLSFPTSCYRCKNLRTLTVLDSRITTISPGSILQMKCLRTLNLSRNNLSEVPKEIGELIHLRYMNLSYSELLKELPDAVCDLYNLQTLALVGCRRLEKLPKAVGKLINLKHLYVCDCDKLRYLPKGIGILESLQVLDNFYICHEEISNDEALKLGDIGFIDQLTIRLGNNSKDDASEIEKAQLGNKEHISHLIVSFQEGAAEPRKGDEEILNALQPHQNLESLWIGYCQIGTAESLYWIRSLHKLREVYLFDWQYCELLPPLGKLPLLEILGISHMEKMKKVGVEFLGIEEEVSGILFPKLEQLSFRFMRNWEEWEGVVKDSSEITVMPHLSSLEIESCPELKALPDFLHKITALRTLEIEGCPILEGEYEKGVGKEWHNISHIPNLTIRRN